MFAPEVGVYLHDVIGYSVITNRDEYIAVTVSSPKSGVIMSVSQSVNQPTNQPIK